MATVGRGRVPQCDMDAGSALLAVDALRAAKVPTWLLGGWAIDALIGRERRGHDDLDLLIRDTDIPLAVGALAALGYTGSLHPEGASYLVDPAGRQIDAHVIELRPDGSAAYRMEDGDWVYPAGAFTGRGTINGREVPCLTAEMMMVEHTTGYELDETHVADVRALAQAFNLSPPQPPG
jgi:lincosamide nucleotidyltransferase A/C/D/E